MTIQLASSCFCKYNLSQFSLLTLGNCRTRLGVSSHFNPGCGKPNACRLLEATVFSYCQQLQPRWAPYLFGIETTSHTCTEIFGSRFQHGCGFGACNCSASVGLLASFLENLRGVQNFCEMSTTCPPPPPLPRYLLKLQRHSEVPTARPRRQS